MFEIDCSDFPSEVTDFAFDHLRDDVTDDEKLDLDYAQQTVIVDTGNMEFVYSVRDRIETRMYERISDMKFEVNQGYNVGLSEEELVDFEGRLVSSELIVNAV